MTGCSFIASLHTSCETAVSDFIRWVDTPLASMGLTLSSWLPKRYLQGRHQARAKLAQDEKTESEGRRCALTRNGDQSSTLVSSQPLADKPHNPTSQQLLRQLVRRGQNSVMTGNRCYAASSCIEQKAMQGTLGITDLLAYAKILV